MTQIELLQNLRAGVQQLTFTKADGTTRVMNCTRNLEIIPLDKHPKTVLVDSENDRITAYDVDAAGWRSFKFSALQ